MFAILLFKLVKKLLRKYGDYSMFDLMNMIVTGNHPLYQKYNKKTDGPNGEKVNMLKTIYKDYYEVAKDITINEFPEIQIEIGEQAIERESKAKDIATERARNPQPQLPILRVPSGAGDTQ
jgi:hypothetical protein